MIKEYRENTHMNKVKHKHSARKQCLQHVWWHIH